MPQTFAAVRSRHFAWLLALTIALLSTSLGLAQDATPTPTADYFPTKEWRTSTPEEQQMDSQLLADMVNTVQTENINLHSLLVIRHGAIVSENYFLRHPADELHDLYSVTKSFVSTLVGIAIDQGFIESLDTPVLDFFPDKAFTNVDDRKKAMTLRDLVTMQSGLAWNEDLMWEMYRSPDAVVYLLNLPMSADPGTTFNYCTGCSHVVSAIIQQAVGKNTRDFAEEVLLAPLGITNIRWRTDREGTPIGGSDLKLTARDMAKLGYLFLHNGEWDGETIVAPEWIQAASTEQVDTGVVVGTGSALNYGLMWWTYPQLNAYAALGYDGQTVFVIPQLDLLVVTTAATVKHDHDEIFALIEDYVIPAVQDLPEGFLAS